MSLLWSFFPNPWKKWKNVIKENEDWGNNSVHNKMLATQAWELRFDPKNPHKMPGVVTHTCKLDWEGRDRMIPEAHWPVRLALWKNSSPTDPVSKQGRLSSWRTLPKVNLWLLHVQVDKNTYRHIYLHTQKMKIWQDVTSSSF